jgi:hypothetical protein
MTGRTASHLAVTAVAAAALAAPAAADAPNVAPLSALEPVLSVLPAPARNAILAPEAANLPAGLDDVNRAPSAVPSSIVPEPATWAMMIAGFGLLGVALRCARRRHPA